MRILNRNLKCMPVKCFDIPATFTVNYKCTYLDLTASDILSFWTDSHGTAINVLKQYKTLKLKEILNNHKL